VLTAPQADALWTALAKEDFAAMESAPRTPTSPHIAHATVLVEWTGARHEVTDGFRIGPPAVNAAFDRVYDAIVAFSPP
jgi:hypothetical protein